MLAKCWATGGRSTQVFCAFVMNMSHAVFISGKATALREWK